MDRLSRYVGTLMRCTPKAVRQGAVANRVFAVCGTLDGDLLAWKCLERPDGRIQHPAFPSPLERTDPSLFRPDRGSGGEEPTALFRPDSFYMQA